MKKSQVERTTADNLEARFDRGEEVLDYFEVAKAQTVLPRKSAAVASTVKNPQSTTAVHEEEGHYGTDVKSDGKKFKGVGKEPDRRRK